MKNITTRPALLVVLIGTLMCAGCTMAWLSEAEQIVAALIPATANLITLAATLQGKTVSIADLQAIRSAGSQAAAELRLMQSLIAEYQKADGTAQPGLLSQIQAALSAVQSTLNDLLPALHIKDAATQAKIAAVLGTLISEAESVAAIVPMLNASAPAEMAMKAERQMKKPPPLSASEFVTSYNATMSAKTGDSELDHATAGLRIHLHGKFSRWASAGLLK